MFERESVSAYVCVCVSMEHETTHHMLACLVLAQHCVRTCACDSVCAHMYIYTCVCVSMEHEKTHNMLARFVLAQHQPHTLVITLLRKLGRPLGAGRRTARGKGAAVRGTAVGDDGSVGGGGHVAHVHVCFCYAACAGAVAENAARVRDLRRELRCVCVCV